MCDFYKGMLLNVKNWHCHYLFLTSAVSIPCYGGHGVRALKKCLQIQVCQQKEFYGSGSLLQQLDWTDILILSINTCLKQIRKNSYINRKPSHCRTVQQLPLRQLDEVSVKNWKVLYSWKLLMLLHCWLIESL